MAVLTMIVLVLVSMTNTVSGIFSSSMGRIQQFRSARNAFETMTRRLSQATLNTYWDYDNPSAPTKYLRQSELRFISGPGLLGAGAATKDMTHTVFFQANLGVIRTAGDLARLKLLLNTCGYYLDFGTDKGYRPPFLDGIPSVKESYRFRLIEMVEPAETLTLYQYTSGKDGSGKIKNLTYAGKDWFTTPLANKALSRVLAENIIALVIQPKLSPQDDPTGNKLSPLYSYDSTAVNADSTINPKHQLPPIIQVTMVALDERSAARIDKGSTMPGLAELGYDPAALFKDATQYQADMAKIEAGLNSKKLRYRIFTSDISIPAAKWSRAQTN
jgi:uncharacterized protein (TIGR02599 family)